MAPSQLAVALVHGRRSRVPGLVGATGLPGCDLFSPVALHGRQVPYEPESPLSLFSSGWNSREMQPGSPRTLESPCQRSSILHLLALFLTPRFHIPPAEASRVKSGVV